MTKESGKYRAVHFRWACNKHLRKAITCFADNSRHASPWAADIYTRAIASGHDHPHAVRILARAWIRVIYRCWTEAWIGWFFVRRRFTRRRFPDASAPYSAWLAGACRRTPRADQAGWACDPRPSPYLICPTRAAAAMLALIDDVQGQPLLRWTEARQQPALR